MSINAKSKNESLVGITIPYISKRFYYNKLLNTLLELNKGRGSPFPPPPLGTSRNFGNSLEGEEERSFGPLSSEHRYAAGIRFPSSSLTNVCKVIENIGIIYIYIYRGVQ